MLYESTSNETKAFKGGDPPIFKLEFIPSVNFTQIFTSDSSKWPSKSKGYHIVDTNSHTIGSTIDDERFV